MTASNKTTRRLLRKMGAMFVLLFSIATSSPLAAQPQPDSKLVSDFGRLRFVDSVHQDDLATVTSVQVSDDGKFLYASAWNTATIVVFKRDVGSGMLTPVQELTDRENQQGVTGVRLSPNRRFAVSSAFRSQTISLFRRLHQDGTLERVSLARDGDEYVTLRWPVDVAFSPDSSFLYVADAGGSSSSPGPGSVVTLCITAGGKLIGVDSNDGDGECFGNVRGIAVHPDGKTIVVAAAKSGTVVVLDCDQKTGKTSVRQIIKDGENDVLAIGGAMGLVLSGDGQFAYVSSGRFGGDNAISAFKFDENGRLSLVQEIVSGEDGLTGFSGGNEITISPDGRNVYAAATNSGSVACLLRSPRSGRLRVLETITEDHDRLAGAAGICTSPDGKFVYVAAERGSMISIFHRDCDEE